MSTMWHNYWKVLKLDVEPFEDLKQVEDSVWPGLKFLFVVGLIAGLGKWVGIVRVLQRPTLSELISQTVGKVQSFADSFLPPILSSPINEAAAGVMAIVSQISQLEPTLGARPSRLIRLGGDWLSTPFQLLTFWIAFSLLLWIVAKLAGGKGSLPQHINGLFLATAPFALGFVWFILTETGTALFYLGLVLALIALVWSLIISAKAMAVTHEIETRLAAWSLVIFLLIIFVGIPLFTVLVTQISVVLSG